MTTLGRQYWAINVQFCFHMDTNNADEPSHPGWRPSTSNWQKQSRSAQRANDIGVWAIGAYIKELEDDQNGTDVLARRLQVASQDAGNTAYADEELVPAVMWASVRCF
jgi:hypothetical protein